MRLTPNAAMRARDVSRPRAEHLAEAEAAEASSRPRSRPPSGDAATGTPEPTAEKTPGVPAGNERAGNERAGRPGFPRRRRARGSR